MFSLFQAYSLQSVQRSNSTCLISRVNQDLLNLRRRAKWARHQPKKKLEMGNAMARYSPKNLMGRNPNQ